MKKLEKRGRQVYHLMGLIQWAAFRFLAVTTAIFIWASFHSYFEAKMGPQAAAILGVVAVMVMFLLIDKGIDSIIEFLADERVNPTRGEEANPKARAWFFRIVMVLAVVRLLATGTTSVWGSFEIADYVTARPDETRITEAMETEAEALDKSRTSLEKSLSEARKTEGQRVKQAKAQGHALVLSSLTHPNPDVNAGFRNKAGWYWTTPKLRKYRDAYKKALADSTALVSAEISKAQELEAALLALNTDGMSRAQEVRDKLAAVAVEEVKGYEARKERRTNFLIIADFLAVIFGIIAIWIRATYRAAVGYESAMEEKTFEGIVSAALRKWWRLFLCWVEKLVGVDLDGDGKVGSVQVKQYRATGETISETIGATAETNAETRRKIGFFKDTEATENAVSNKVSAVSVDLNDVAKQLERARGKFRSYRSRVAKTPETIQRNGETILNPAYRTALAGLKRAEAEIAQLEKLLS